MNIIGHVCKFALDVKMCIGFAPLYRIGPRSDGGGLMEGQSQENFFWADGRGTADGGRRTKREVKTSF